MPVTFETRALLPQVVYQNTPRFLWTPLGIFTIVFLLGYFVIPVMSWIFPILAAIFGFTFGYYTMPSWIPLAIGGIGAVYAVKTHRETGSQRWGNLRWLFIPAVIGALTNVSDMPILVPF